ncbi:hypothetical protein PEBR_35273 [Penicillium brasilianum]|uniref:Uncharacterized protein n=1 Tax=Penicillium brasilianum TaxID=104259 RepID=A0A1S9RCS2_PENBI|nr:hypothetical protein PEBR_35273 [Penicillium brasilianum]
MGQEQEIHTFSDSEASGANRIIDFTVHTRIDTEVKDLKEIGSLDFDIDVIATKVYGFGAGNKSGLSGKEMQSILGKGMVRVKDRLLEMGSSAKLGDGMNRFGTVLGV